MIELHFYDPFVNQLVSYFGDDEDAVAIPHLRSHIKANKHVRSLWRDGLKELLTDPPPLDRVKLVQAYANRQVYSDTEARAWLAALQAKLFGE
jgi:hypothetical protein